MKLIFSTLLMAGFAAPVFAESGVAPFDEAAWQAEFSSGDTDGDGKLSREEAKAGNPNMTDDMFDQIDANSDGFISPEEDKAMLRRAKAARAKK